MGKGVLYKCNGTTWSKSQAKDTSNTSDIWDNGLIKHSDGTSWFDNYPMEQLYEQTFNATWTQGYQGDGVALYNGTFWEHDLVVGDPLNFRSLIGFNRSAIQAFIQGGTVTQLQLLINLKSASTDGKADVYFGKHSYDTEPATYTGQGDWGDQAHKQFPVQGLGGYWISLNPTQATQANGITAISGIAMRAATATAEDMARFNGTTTFTTQLKIKVLK